MSPLERRYRRLLRCYPKSYRDSRGDEIVSTLLDLAPPGRTRPTPAEAADLVEGGLRRRLGADGFDEGLALAAPVALALLGGVSAFLWWRVEPVGPPTLAPVAYAAWLAACLVALCGPARFTRPALGAALAVTLALPVAAPLTAYARPPLWVLMTFTVFGLVALAGTDPFPRDAERRATPAAGALATAAGAELVRAVWPAPLAGYYQPAFAQVGVVVAVAVGVLAVLTLVAARSAAGGRFAAMRARWATLLIGLPGAWLGPLDTDTWRVAGELPRFGRLAQVLLGTCLVLAAMAHLRARAARQPVGPRPAGGRLVGAVLVGYALGLLLFVGWIGAVTGHAAATAGVCAAGGVLFGLPAARRALAVVALSAAATAAAAYAVAVYGNYWTLTGWTELTRTAGLAVTLAVVPLAAAVYAAYRAPRRLPAVAAGLLCAGWLCWLIVPDLPAWGPVLPVLLAVPATLSIPVWRPRTGP